MKKMVLLALLMALVSAGVAEESWGILAFMAEQGKSPVEEVLRTECEQQVVPKDNGLLQVRVEEALYDGLALYLAVTVKPVEDRTLVIPFVEDISAEGSLAVMDHPDYDPGLSVQEYAAEKGCGRVIALRLSLPEEQSYGLEYAAWEHAEDGSLRMILQYGCTEALDEALLCIEAQVYSAATAEMIGSTELRLACWLR